MEKVIQGSFKPRQSHTTGHTQGTFGKENNNTTAEVLLAVRTLKNIETEWMRHKVFD